MDPNTSPNGLIDKLALYLYSLVAGRDRRLVLGTLLLVIVAGVGASQLYISQDFRRMLPQDLRAFGNFSISINGSVTRVTSMLSSRALSGL